jgi:predicted nucleic acid-binding protein
MYAIDTDIVVRYLVVDEPKRHERATRRIEGGPVRVSLAVFLETEWAPRSIYRRDDATILALLRKFSRLPTIVVPQSEVLANALDWAEDGMEFADALHLAAAADIEGMLSFDRDLAKRAAKLGAPRVEAP